MANLYKPSSSHDFWLVFQVSKQTDKTVCTHFPDKKLVVRINLDSDGNRFLEEKDRWKVDKVAQQKVLKNIQEDSEETAA